MSQPPGSADDGWLPVSQHEDCRASPLLSFARQQTAAEDSLRAARHAADELLEGDQPQAEMLDQRLDAAQIDDQQADRRNPSRRRNERSAVFLWREAMSDGRIRVHARRLRKFDAVCPQTAT
jgi:hypothetical protein